MAIEIEDRTQPEAPDPEGTPLARRIGAASVWFMFAAVFGFAVYGFIDAAQSLLAEPPPPSCYRALEQCEALLGKSINLTTSCVNARERERCP